MSAAQKLEAPPVRERPILFSAPMVRAILNGTKTQTRRVVAGQASTAGREHFPMGGLHWENDADVLADWRKLRCHFGTPGDRLWVREAWRDSGESEGVESVVYRADGDERGLWRPSIHMPRWASRIDLEVLSTRVERLQDISEEDARAEGVNRITAKVPTHRDAFHYLWEEISGERSDCSWDANPWVWVVGFKRVAR